MSDVTYAGRSLASYHDQQLRFRFERVGDQVSIVAESEPAAALLGGATPERTRQLVGGIERIAREESGQDLGHVVLSRTREAHGAALLEARATDPAWQELAASMTPAQVEASTDLFIDTDGIARNGWMLLGATESRRVGTWLAGAEPDNVRLDDLPHLVTHESLHLDPATHLDEVEKLPLEEAFVDFRARDPRALARAAEAMGIPHVRPYVPQALDVNVAGFERLLTLAGHDVSSDTARAGLQDAMHGADLASLIDDSISRIANGSGVTLTDALFDDARYLVAHATSPATMDAAVAALRVAR